MTDWSTDERAQDAWKTLCGMYGSRMIRAYGEELPDVWKAAIRRLSDHQLRRGFAALGNSGDVHAPTLPAFLHACKTITATEAASMAKRLPAPEFGQFHREGQLGLMRFLMKQGGVHPDILPKLVQAKNSVVEHCRLLDADGDPEGRKLPLHLRKQLKAVMEAHR